LFSSYEQFCQHVNVVSVTDQQIKETISSLYQQHEIIICPHTATAYYARQLLLDEPWVVVATADPAKFEEIIEPLLGVELPVPPQLADLLERDTKTYAVDFDLGELHSFAVKYFLDK